MSKTDELSETIHKWWQAELENEHDGAARALSARLRRASGFVEVLSEEPVFDLGQSLKERHNRHVPPHMLACLVLALAQVRENTRESLARRFGEVVGETVVGKDRKKTRRLSASRFQRIIRTEELPELVTQLRRALPIVGNACNAGRLGRDILFWEESTKVRWLSDYFDKRNVLETDSETTEQTVEATP